MDEKGEGTWRVRVDTGGTFTDGWGMSPEGREVRCKVLSDGSWVGRVVSEKDGWVEVDGVDGMDARGLVGLMDEGLGEVLEVSGTRVRFCDWHGGCKPPPRVVLRSGEEAPVLAARLLTGTRYPEKLPEMDFRVATTRGTNALLEGKGARLLLVVTRGFGDLLEIRDQRRKWLFSLVQPEEGVLAERVVGIRGRLSAAGEIVERPDEGEVRAVGRAALGEGIEVAAVSLMHAWRDGGMEREVAGWLREEGFREVRISSDAAVIGYLARTETVVADAWLAPVMGAFTRSVADAMGAGEPLMMTSAGGLVEASRFAPKDSLLSGPAGGLVGAAAVARAAGFQKILTFDMGGTSTDVARIDGEFRYRYEQAVGDARVLAPALRMETVAAGGGSICQWKQGRLEVGPESAGAMPGPACYGRGGPLTLTDVNLLLGLMKVEGAGIPLSWEAACGAFQELYARRPGGGVVGMEGGRLDADTGMEEGRLEVTATGMDFLRGLRRIGVERMAGAIRGVSVREGHDPREYGLLAFGGAGPQHACDVAEVLGISTVIVPGDAGLLSAWGLERARRQEVFFRQVLEPLEEDSSLRIDVPREATVRSGCRHFVELRLRGQGVGIEVEVVEGEGVEEVRGNFSEEYMKLYGYACDGGREVEIVSLRMVMEEPGGGYRRENFGGEVVEGPAVLQDRFSTCVIGAGWGMRRGDGGSLLMEFHRLEAVGSQRDEEGVVRAALFRSRFEGVVGEMGELLRRTAVSTNVKERLDFSCALLDADGRLVVNAPHVPVHLGALGVCVREVAGVIDFLPGDVVVTNHPGFGGSHLPDVTMMAGVFEGERLIGYVANRAHHAEMGGMAPGSMPAGAACLEEEGVLIAPRYWMRGGRVFREEMRAIMLGGRYPTRRVEENLVDMEAQAASARYGTGVMGKMVKEEGCEVVTGEMRGILEGSARLMRRLLEKVTGEGGRFETRMDDGSLLKVGIDFPDGGMRFDFSGTSGVHRGNLNATPAIVRSVVLYVLRVWLGEDVPLNEGLLEGVEILVPEGCMLNPKFSKGAGDERKGRTVMPSGRYDPAVVGGNVETSQRIADLLLGALELCANGQGTMNNFLFENGRDGYYETIGGGAGATDSADGRSGRHVHMTNTAITDAEALEHRFPLRLREFSIRRGAGGEGRFRGGDGLVREIEFLEETTVSFLTERRTTAPAGQKGGKDGAMGRQVRIFPDGREEEMAGSVTVEFGVGERVRIETPGGGGWGEPMDV